MRKKLAFLVSLAGGITLIGAACATEQTNQSAGTPAETNINTIVNVAPNPAPSAPALGKTYSNDKWGFSLQYPNDAAYTQNPNPEDNSYWVRFNLPFEQNTLLSEKYLDLIAFPGACAAKESTMDPISNPENVTINGIQYKKGKTQGAAAGNIYEGERYSTEKDGTCYIYDFILHSTQAGNYDNPPKVFDRAKESAVFMDIMNSVKYFEPAALPYINTKFNFSLEFPHTWIGSKAANHANDVCFSFGVSQPVCIFQIYVYSKAEWDKIGKKPTYIAERGSQIFSYDAPLACAQLTDFECARSKEIPGIIKTFKFTE